MYAIIESGGKQFIVKQGDIIDVELLKESNGSAVEFKNVLLVNDGKTTRVGKPHVEGLVVKGEILGEAKGPKVIAYKYKRRQGYRRKVGHRQKYSRIRIDNIGA